MRVSALLLAGLAFLSPLPLAAQAVPDVHAAQRVRADIEFLAADSLEGRDTGSRGYLIAADYVAAQFRAIGLVPASAVVHG